VACLLAAAGCRDGGSGPSPGPAAAPTSAPAPRPAPVRFAVWGDAPYTVAERALVARLVDEVNAAGVAFTANVGDLKGGGECDDAVLARARETFSRFEAPLVYVPGDNEWTDCWGSGQDPLERLAALRRTMYPDGRSFGLRPLTLDQQRPDHPEHSRWREGALTAIGLHVVGSNNNPVSPPSAGVVATGPPRSEASRAAAEAEFRARDEAAAAWLREGFDAALAAGSAAVAVFVQADPRLHVPAAERAARAVDGYDRFVAVLVEQAARFPGPVVLLHGDTHFFRQDRPFGDEAPNVVRVETYGSPLVGWVEVTVDPAAPEPVVAVPHRVEAPAGR
jgi:hypothetical protein